MVTTDIQNTGTEKSDFPGEERFVATSFSIGNIVYLGLGYSENYAVKDFLEWDQATDIWIKKTLLAGTARASAFGVSIGNKGYIGTGYMFNGESDESIYLNDLWEFDPALE